MDKLGEAVSIIHEPFYKKNVVGVIIKDYPYFLGFVTTGNVYTSFLDEIGFTGHTNVNFDNIVRYVQRNEELHALWML